MNKLILIMALVFAMPLSMYAQEETSSFKDNASERYGTRNSAFGFDSGLSLGSRSYGNTLLGAGSGYLLKDTDGNTFIGTDAGRRTQEGRNNTFVGFESGINNKEGGEGNVFLGYKSGHPEKPTYNKLYITNHATESPLIWGDFKGAIVNINGSLGVGTTNPAETVHIMGNIRGNATGGALRVRTASGYLDIGAQNTSWAHIYTDRSKIILNKDVYTVTGGFSAYNSSDLKLKTSGEEKLIIKRETGNVGIGTSVPDEKLTVKGKIHTQEVRVDLDGAVAPDYVFESDYNLLPLKDIEAYITKNKHLPEIPSAKEMEENGIQLKMMNLRLLQKIEELTLHTIQQQKEIEQQKKKNETLEQRLERLESLIKE